MHKQSRLTGPGLIIQPQRQAAYKASPVYLLIRVSFHVLCRRAFSLRFYLNGKLLTQGAKFNPPKISAPVKLLRQYTVNHTAFTVYKIPICHLLRLKLNERSVCLNLHSHISPATGCNVNGILHSRHKLFIYPSPGIYSQLHRLLYL